MGERDGGNRGGEHGMCMERTPCIARVNGPGAVVVYVPELKSADAAPCPYCATLGTEYLSGAATCLSAHGLEMHRLRALGGAHRGGSQERIFNTPSSCTGEGRLTGPGCRRPA